MYEALEPEQPLCLYSHNDLEFPENLEYLSLLQEKGFMIKTGHPFLEYFELMDRGISFLTLINAWCVPLLVGTTFLDWLKDIGASCPQEGVMFRGITGGEYSHAFHCYLELNKNLDIPTFYPMLNYSKEDIFDLLNKRYGIPLNPIYRHMDRTYCLCCYTSDKKRQSYCKLHYPELYDKYYRQIEEMIFKSGLINKVHQEERFKTKEEKLQRHGFAHWHRIKAQNVVGAIKYSLPYGGLCYSIRNMDWINTKHLEPVKGRWTQKDNEIRFWNVPENVADSLIKRMLNCLDCGFCIVECFKARGYDRENKSLTISNCIQCGNCFTLKHCMGWKHRFWRRIIVNGG